MKLRGKMRKRRELRKKDGEIGIAQKGEEKHKRQSMRRESTSRIERDCVTDRKHATERGSEEEASKKKIHARLRNYRETQSALGRERAPEREGRPSKKKAGDRESMQERKDYTEENCVRERGEKKGGSEKKR